MEWRLPSKQTQSPGEERITTSVPSATSSAAARDRLLDTKINTKPPEETMEQPPRATNVALLQTPNASLSPSTVTTGEAMDAVAAQCERRGLTNAATWLSEMSLHAVPFILASPLPLTSSLMLVVQELDKDVVHPTSSSTLSLQQQRFQRLHRVALGYFTKGEFQRCHQTILREVMRTGEANSVLNSTAAWRREEEAEEKGSAPLGAGGGDAPSLPSPEVVRGFRTTSLPPLLQFLSLYALFMDGMKAKQLSNNANTGTGGGGGAQRAVHPHAHVLRVYLLEAMRNPINTLRPTASHTDSVPGNHLFSDANALYGGSTEENRSVTVTSEGRSETAPPFQHLGGAVVAEHWDPHTPSTKKQPWTITSASRSLGTKSGGEGAVLKNVDDGRSSVGSRVFSNLSPGTNGKNPLRPNNNTSSSPDATAAAAAAGLPLPSTHTENNSATDLLHIDPYLTWLMGVVLRELRMRQECATFLLAAVTVNPLLRCAWEDLTSLVSREAQLTELDVALEGLEPHFMTDIFASEVRGLLGVTPVSSLRLRSAAAAAAAAVVTPTSVATTTLGKEDEERVAAQRSLVASTSPLPPPSSFPTPLSAAPPHAINGVSDAVGSSANVARPNLGPEKSNPNRDGKQPLPSPNTAFTAAALTNAWECLTLLFPHTPSLLSQLAHFYYHQRNRLDKAETIYQRIRRLDPHYYGILYDYSNLLYTKRDRLGLSSLVQAVYHADAFRAETNFAVGNYYVLLGQHDRAALHFHRTTAIDPQCAEAWLLLGHAYVEVKNTTAAVEAYRTAVELNERDYRGWYNLGQIYELLEAYHHALYYYWHTTSLRPADPGMWVAVANCLEHDGRVAESIACLERAETYDVNISPNYPAYVRRIATHHIANSSFTRACVYLEKLVQSPAATGEDLLLALPFLIQHYVQRARKSMELSARSSSYDPALFSPGMNLSPSSSPPSASAGRTALHHARAAAALQHLRKAEEHLEAMAELVMPVGTSLSNTADGQTQQSMTEDNEGEAVPITGLENFTGDVSASGKRRSKQMSGGAAAHRASTASATAAAPAPMANACELPPVVFVRSRHREINALRAQAMQLLHPPTQQQQSMPASSTAATASAPGNPKSFFPAYTVGRH